MIRALVDRTGIDPKLIEDVKWGCVKQEGEQGFDIARTAALIAGLPVETPGVSIQRNCASSLSAINLAAVSALAGGEEVQIAGGVEHMDHIPMTKNIDPSAQLFKNHSPAVMHMGLTAENLALKHKIDRKRQDEFAFRSHRLAEEATRQGRFTSEVVRTWGRDESGRKSLLTRDQCIRPDCTVEGLGALEPAFLPRGGTVTAGNSSPLNVGAAAMLVMSESKSKELGLKPLARIVSMASAGVDPAEMGIGPVPAVHKALARAGVQLKDVGAIELNEAFAVQVLAVLKMLGIDEERVNTRGGAIAIGHPLGASGARIATTLLYRMRDEGHRYGVATMCVGMGQGVATLFELCG